MGQEEVSASIFVNYEVESIFRNLTRSIKRKKKRGIGLKGSDCLV